MPRSPGSCDSWCATACTGSSVTGSFSARSSWYCSPPACWPRSNGKRTFILLRHGRSTSNTAHTLAGRSEGVDLDDKGREQAQTVVTRIGDLPVKAIVRSPLLRCERTVEPLAAALGVQPVVEERIIEV